MQDQISNSKQQQSNIQKKKNQIVLLDLLDKCTQICRDDRLFLRDKFKENDEFLYQLLKQNTRQRDLDGLQIQLRKYLKSIRSQEPQYQYFLNKRPNSVDPNANNYNGNPQSQSSQHQSPPRQYGSPYKSQSGFSPAPNYQGVNKMVHNYQIPAHNEQFYQNHDDSNLREILTQQNKNRKYMHQPYVPPPPKPKRSPQKNQDLNTNNQQLQEQGYPDYDNAQDLHHHNQIQQNNNPQQNYYNNQVQPEQQEEEHHHHQHNQDQNQQNNNFNPNQMSQQEKEQQQQMMLAKYIAEQQQQIPEHENELENSPSVQDYQENQQNDHSHNENQNQYDNHQHQHEYENENDLQEHQHQQQDEHEYENQDNCDNNDHNQQQMTEGDEQCSEQQIRDQYNQEQNQHQYQEQEQEQNHLHQYQQQELENQHQYEEEIEHVKRHAPQQEQEQPEICESENNQSHCSSEQNQQNEYRDHSPHSISQRQHTDQESPRKSQLYNQSPSHNNRSHISSHSNIQQQAQQSEQKQQQDIQPLSHQKEGSPKSQRYQQQQSPQRQQDSHTDLRSSQNPYQNNTYNTYKSSYTYNQSSYTNPSLGLSVQQQPRVVTTQEPQNLSQTVVRRVVSPNNNEQTKDSNLDSLLSKYAPQSVKQSSQQQPETSSTTYYRQSETEVKQPETVTRTYYKSPETTTTYQQPQSSYTYQTSQQQQQPEQQSSTSYQLPNYSQQPLRQSVNSIGKSSSSLRTSVAVNNNPYQPQGQNPYSYQQQSSSYVSSSQIPQERVSQYSNSENIRQSQQVLQSSTIRRNPQISGSGLGQSLRYSQIPLSAGFKDKMKYYSVEEILQILYTNFTITDRNLSKEFFISKLKQFFPQPEHASEIDRLFDFCSVRSNGALDVNQIANVLDKMCTGQSQKDNKVRKLFQKIDVDNVGKIIKSDFSQYLNNIPQIYEKQRIADQIFSQYDHSQKGYLTYWDLLIEQKQSQVAQVLQYV